MPERRQRFDAWRLPDRRQDISQDRRALKPFRLIPFCHWCAPDNPLTLGCNAERGDSCRFSAPTYSSKITGLKENFSTPDISSPDCILKELSELALDFDFEAIGFE